MDQGWAGDASDLGDPTVAADYTLCVYGNGTLLLTMTVPSGPAWRDLWSAATASQVSDAPGANN